MNWTVETAEDEDAWTHDYLKEVLATPCLPAKQNRVGSSEVKWKELDPGIAWVGASGGSPDDNRLAEAMVTDQLSAHGYERAIFTFDRQHKTADWNDIMGKAKRLIQSGQVTMLRNGVNNVVAHVVGDHGEYTCEIGRDDPNSRAITSWQCECPWDQFAWQRTRQWKKYEGRPCAHVLAAYWTGLSTPLDEAGEGGPGQRGFQPQVPGDIPGVQQKLPFAEKPQEPVKMPSEPLTAPAPTGQPTPSQEPMQEPQQLSILPPSPQEQMEQLQLVPPGQTPVGQKPLPGTTVSVPGARPPTPFGPVQTPGTYSSTDWVFTSDTQFANGDIVRLKDAEYGQMVGKSDAHGNGKWKEIPTNSIGEVMAQDETTGWVEVNFPGPQADAGELEPYHVTAFLEPNQLQAMPNQKNPFIGT